MTSKTRLMMITILSGPIFSITTSHAQAPPTIEQVLAKWNERQNKVVSARFRWDTEVTRPKGAVSWALKGMGQIKDDAVYPPSDHTYVKPRYVCFDKDKLRYEVEELHWREKIEESHRVLAFDGKEGKTINRHDGKVTTGIIRPENHHFAIGNFHIRAILMTYRPLHPNMSPCMGADYKVTGRRAVIGGADCFEISASRRNYATVYIWIDPRRDYIPVRQLLRGDKTDVARVDTEYVEHAEAGWTPTSWSLVINYPDGTRSESARARISECEINVRIPEKDFDPEFPVGTYVQDLKNNEAFIQKEDGDRRIVPRSEFSRPYEELVRTQGPWRWQRLKSWPILGGAIALVASALVISLWKRSRRKAAVG